jgi:hypothetical protein
MRASAAQAWTKAQGEFARRAVMRALDIASIVPRPL